MNIVAHNMIAMNAQRYLGINTGSKAKSTEKLSSGYRINRAADDAAGLSISEKMRRQIRGLKQGADNIQDGISLCQVADGALNETQDILQRMNQLAVQAANGTYTSEERGYIQDEIDQLIEEVDKIANDTNFNEEIYPLLGERVEIDVPESGNTSGTDDVGGTSQITSQDLLQKFKQTTVTFQVGVITIFDGVTYNAGDTVTTNIVYSCTEYDSTTYTLGSHVDCATQVSHPWKTDLDNDFDMHMSEEYTKLFSALGRYDYEEYRGLTLDDLYTDDDGVYYISQMSHGNHKIYIASVNGSSSSGDDSTGSGGTSGGQSGDSGQTGSSGNGEASVTSYNGDVWIQMGTEVGQGMYINLVDATAKGIGVTDVDVTTTSNAGSAISIIENAIHKVSEYRSTFGAQQNRLEHGYNANMNTAENTTAAESRIRDTDMAKEMVKYSNLNILEQVGHAMMAQANQSNQGVLSLLQ